MLIDMVVAAATMLAAAAIAYLGLAHDIELGGLTLLIFGFILSELLTRRGDFEVTGLKMTGFVLALIAALACAVLGHLAVLRIAAFDGAPDMARQFFAPLTMGAICASTGALAYRARYRAPLSFVIALAAGLYAIYGILRLSFGNGPPRL